jgi:hypothetical protein
MFSLYIFQVGSAKPQWNAATSKPSTLATTTSKPTSGTTKVDNQKTFLEKQNKSFTRKF